MDVAQCRAPDVVELRARVRGLESTLEALELRRRALLRSGTAVPAAMAAAMTEFRDELDDVRTSLEVIADAAQTRR